MRDALEVLYLVAFPAALGFLMGYLAGRRTR
jgi:hypothetical protein